MKIKFKYLALFLFTLFLVEGCGKKEEFVKIGAIVPQTGPFAVYGDPVKKGMLLAVDEINKNGGINGEKVDLVIEDDGGDPTNAANAFTKLVNENIKVVLGPLSSGASLATAPIAERNKVIQISTLAGTLDLSDAGDYVFRIYPASDVASRFIAQEVPDRFKAKNVAVFYANDAFGRTASKFVMEVLHKNNINILEEETFNSGDNNFKPQLVKIKNKKPDLIVCSAYYEDGAKILIQAKELGINVPFLGEDGWFGPIAGLVGDAIQNLYFANVSFGPEFQDNKIMQDFIDNYEKKFGEKPTAGSAAGYDGIYMIVKLIHENGYDAEKMKDALYDLDYIGAFGGIKFNKNGDNIGAKYSLFQLDKDNNPHLIKE